MAEKRSGVLVSVVFINLSFIAFCHALFRASGLDTPGARRTLRQFSPKTGLHLHWHPGAIAVGGTITIVAANHLG